MQPDAYHCPSMLMTIQSVYSSESPGAPKGTSGHESGPSRFVKSTCTPSGARSKRVIFAVRSHVEMSGEFMIVDIVKSKSVGGGGGAGHDTVTSCADDAPNHVTSSCTMRQSDANVCPS